VCEETDDEHMSSMRNESMNEFMIVERKERHGFYAQTTATLVLIDLLIFFSLLLMGFLHTSFYLDIVVG
jgi:hypothetical protein